jgi:hypothetical protein
VCRTLWSPASKLRQDLASAAHGKNVGREGELHPTIHRDSSSSNSRLGAEGLGPTQCRKAEKGAQKHMPVIQEGSYSLYRLDADSNSVHRSVSNTYKVDKQILLTHVPQALLKKN